jgi:hypothetical protein
MSRGSWPRQWGLVPAGVVVSALLAGCSLLPGGGSDAEPTPGATPAATVAAASASPSPAATTDGPVGPSISISGFPSPVPSSPETSKGGDKGLPIGQTRIRGRASSATWDVAIPVFSGPAVAAEANRRVRAAADGLIGQVRREAKDDRGVKRTLNGTGTVVTNDGRTVQVTIMFTDFLEGTARPSAYVTTTVVDIRRARPVLLTQVIENPPEGLRFLRSEVVTAAKKKGEPVDTAGLAPRVANWANWQSSPAGLTFHFAEYQLGGAGIRSYTVPWSRARLVLSAYGEKLLAPQ